MTENIQFVRLDKEETAVSYGIAKKQKNKNGKIYYIDWVTWEDAPEDRRLINFKTIEPTEVVIPPTLPKGYQMNWHYSWEEIFDRIYNKERDKAASFDRLDLIVADYELMIKAIGNPDMDNPIWSDREDYRNYLCEFDNSWEDLKLNLSNSIQELFQEACPHFENNNRKMSPSLKEALLQMFPEIEASALNSIGDRLGKYIT
jgi:hypothetical protein